MKKSVKNPQKRYIFSKTGAKCPAALVLGRIVRYNTLNNYPYVPVWPAMRYAEVFMNHFALNGVISPQELYYYALRAVAMLIVIPFLSLIHI